ncbi:MAG: NADH:ubiquinone reductase (Na(+)-transporting) subunit F [Pirellulales bacterium]|nr:NADH:ubiquinone reductase (Na(+)-transporting) subunit F [Pirellulales bacterium]
MPNIQLNDYSLVGRDTVRAIDNGLAEAAWYASPVPKEKMRELLERRDGPAIRDTLIWFGILIGAGICGYLLWNMHSWWAVVPFAIYGIIYGTTSDSRWHEPSHGTAFKTPWMNDVLYEIASFMVMRESVRWRWSHTRHHSDTLIVGRDAEIAVPRPPNLMALALSFFGVHSTINFFRLIALHSTGRLNAEEKTFIPESEYGKLFLRARIYIAIYAGVAVLAIYTGSILPFMFIGLPSMYGAWLMPIYGYTQHAGLAENVLDHRLNCRTVYMNFIHRYLYWNMNYHVEHHMFPLVPYHNLPKLHEAVKADMPKAYGSIFEAWREIVPTVLRQVKDPAYFVQRELPTPSLRADSPPATHIFTAKGKPVGGWAEICAGSFLKNEDVLRFDHEGKTYAVYRTADGALHATDGICTHGNAHLAEGFVSGTQVECAKHNGRFDVLDGSPRRLPACTALTTYKVREHDGKIFLDLNSAGGQGIALRPPTWHFRVVANENVATFIKELVLELEPGSPPLDFRPGDYLQFEIPAYGEISFREIAVGAPFAEIWQAQDLFALRAENPLPVRRNFSIASNPRTDAQLRFNVRIGTPPRGLECSAGAGTTYLFRLKPGDKISAIGPFGDFHVKPTGKEMVYLGGGAGMAPIRSHLAFLFETEKTGRKVSYWFGARSLKESFYVDYFENLARQFSNFAFRLALSAPLPEDNWNSFTGNIHEVLRKEYLSAHPDPASLEYYLCGPPALVQAALGMLDELKVDRRQIAFDEF